MRPKRTWEEMNCPPRPLIFEGWADYMADKLPSTFQWRPIDFPNTPPPIDTARLYYRVGWTALALWDGKIYFVDEILGFDAMVDLLRSRVPRFICYLSLTRDFGYE